MLVVLGLPHLVLTHICNDDGFFFTASGYGFAPDVVDNMGRIKMAIVRQIDDVANRSIALHAVDLAKPARVGFFGQ